MDPTMTVRIRTAHIKMDHLVSSAVSRDSVERACSAVNSILVDEVFRVNVMPAGPCVAPTIDTSRQYHTRKFYHPD